jgi:NAD-dependent dihydropyrimidine dehydrogenase PreA subunit
MDFPRDLATLHDNIFSSRPEHIPAGLDKLWVELYEKEGWAEEVGNMLSSLGTRVLRTIPVRNSLPAGTELLPQESIQAIIEAHKDLITVRNCCCRTEAKHCDHPTDVCMQFSTRAEYDLYRGSGRKVSADEAMEVALKAGDSGLVPTVTNISKVDGLDFICFCCGCCCLVINPGLRVGKLDKVLAPSRYLPEVDNAKCNACAECVEQCCVDAVTMQKVAGFDDERAVIDESKCLGCGACVPVCPEAGALVMKQVRPAEFIPEVLFGADSVLHMAGATGDVPG